MKLLVLQVLVPLMFIGQGFFFLSEVLKSECLNEPRDDLVEREAFIELKEKIEAADSLWRTVAFVSSDLQEVAKLHPSINKQQGLDSNNDGSSSSGSQKRIKTADTSNTIEPEHQQGLDSNNDGSSSSGSQERIKTADTSNTIEPEHQETAIVKSSRLMKNFKKLESPYFSTRRRALKPLVIPLTLNARTSSDGKGSLVDISSSNSFPPINRLSQKNKANGLTRLSTVYRSICRLGI
ncbi:putative WD-repeat protein SPA1/2/3/4 [Helianthus debilis subsp. tardiflorus]